MYINKLIVIVLIIVIIIIIIIINECAYAINGNILHFLLTEFFSRVNSIRSLYTLKGH